MSTAETGLANCEPTGIGTAHGTRGMAFTTKESPASLLCDKAEYERDEVALATFIFCAEWRQALCHHDHRRSWGVKRCPQP